MKGRLADSGESDFVEIEVESLSFPVLLRACCEELEVSVMDVSKIRKLPNVIVRKDRDVQRLKPGQELELVLKNHVSSSSSLYVNPFATVNTSHTVQLLNVNPIMSREIDNGASISDPLSEQPVRPS